MMSFFSVYTFAFFILYAIPSTATLRHGHAANEIQERNVDRHLQAKKVMPEKTYLLELHVNSKANLETTLCKERADLLPFNDYLGVVLNETGRRILEKVATAKHIPLRDTVFFVEVSKHRRLEDKEEASSSHEVDERHLQNGYVWKVLIICNLCSVDNNDGRMLRQLGHYERNIWNVLTSGVQRGLQSACNIQNFEVVIIDES